jgi:hypothetical protein
MRPHAHRFIPPFLPSHSYQRRLPDRLARHRLHAHSPRAATATRHPSAKVTTRPSATSSSPLPFSCVLDRRFELPGLRHRFSCEARARGRQQRSHYRSGSEPRPAAVRSARRARVRLQLAPPPFLNGLRREEHQALLRAYRDFGDERHVSRPTFPVTPAAFSSEDQPRREEACAVTVPEGTWAHNGGAAPLIRRPVIRSRPGTTRVPQSTASPHLRSLWLISICAVCRSLRRSGVRNVGTPWAAERSRAVSGSGGTSSSA